MSPNCSRAMAEADIASGLLLGLIPGPTADRGLILAVRLLSDEFEP